MPRVFQRSVLARDALFFWHSRAGHNHTPDPAVFRQCDFFCTGNSARIAIRPFHSRAITMQLTGLDFHVQHNAQLVVCRTVRSSLSTLACPPPALSMPAGTHQPHILIDRNRMRRVQESISFLHDLVAGLLAQVLKSVCYTAEFFLVFSVCHGLSSHADTSGSRVFIRMHHDLVFP